MREHLKPLEEVRKRFKGTVNKFGTKRGWEGRTLHTILLVKIIDISTNKEVADHLWLNYTKQFQQLNLKEGDIVEFDSRVKEYTKGYFGYRDDLEYEKPIEKDYKLSHPTKVKKVNIGIEGLRKVGDSLWFEYHCFESDESQDAELWHHSHQKVKVLGIAPNDGMKIPSLKERRDSGQPINYFIRFKDGFESEAAEDELMDNPRLFYRPNPPKVKQDGIQRKLEK